jgi:hypothetical protein
MQESLFASSISLYVTLPQLTAFLSLQFSGNFQVSLQLWRTEQ